MSLRMALFCPGIFKNRGELGESAAILDERVFPRVDLRDFYPQHPLAP